MSRPRLTLLTGGGTRMERDQLHEAMRLSLIMPDKRADRHNSYPLTRAARRDEARAQFALRARSGQVENVVPLYGRLDPEPPGAAA